MVGRGPTRPFSEVELKLEFDPADSARLAAHPALEASLAPAQDQDLVSIYYDTPDCVLHKRGVYLRLRERNGRYLQTVKTAASKSDMLERHEWEHELARPELDLDSVDGTALAPLLTPEVRRALQPVFETRLRRHVCRVDEGGSEVEIAIDRGEIATRRHTWPISELELELKRGDKAALFRLARVLAETVPLRLEVKTKADRGYELLQEEKSKAEKARSLDIPPETTASDAFRAIALSCLRQIVANEPAMCAGRAEALHQMRIGIRRLRAAIVVFGDVVDDDALEGIKGELRWIMQELGPARDLDVFEAEFLQPLRANQAEAVALSLSEREFAEKRQAAYARAAAAARSDRFRRTMLNLAEWIEIGAWTTDNDTAERRTRPVAKHARKKLARLRKLIKRKGGDLRHRSVRQRHRLRIRAKRLRYATEFFAGTFQGEACAKRQSESLAALKDLQDALGGLNDLATRHALIADSRDEHPDGRALPPDALADAEAQAEILLQKAEQAYRRFAGTKPFWKS